MEIQLPEDFDPERFRVNHAKFMSTFGKPEGEYNTGLFSVNLKDGIVICTVGLENGEIETMTRDDYNKRYNKSTPW